MKFQSVAAIHPHWRADLLLQINGDNVAHGNAWSWGKYSLQNDTLIVRWNDYPQDRFLFVGGVYLHESFSGGIIGNFNDFRKIGIAGINIDVAKMEVVIPETNQSVKLRTNTSDGDVFLQVFINKEYVSPYMPKNAKKIVDLGANIGLATIFFCNKYPEAELFAVEPGHENFQLLKYNTSFLRNRVKCEQAAAWHSNGKVKIVDHDNDGSHLGAWGLQVRDDYSSDGTIPSYNLSDMFDQAKFDEVDILKIDIEGAELEVFSLGDRSWIDRVNFICVETHDRFRQGTEHAVRSALADKFFELPQSGENLLFSKK